MPFSADATDRTGSFQDIDTFNPLSLSVEPEHHPIPLSTPISIQPLAWQPWPNLLPKPPHNHQTDHILSNIAPMHFKKSDSGSSKKSIRREENNAAARRYRQKRLDRISELEAALETMTKERNDLRLNLAGAEAEIGILKDLMRGVEM
ncbi:hypothetical protein M501DRAFT_1001732 [Patellaria atrata CBS 101060]|uniref:BZIP domain-containing protein n=1 Tax=Patellaria atrata CBS 101060 TaxID=1346257 RepID=A0A9P4VSR9_9PEZI|nr:hypothetical protein M501DRAFT_1001732 [Patellaria atrata CBS 101060]